MDDSLFLFLALAFLGAMLFYSSRKRKKAAETLRAQVVKGAYVMLTSGIYGKITSISDSRIELQTSPGQKLTVAVGAVRSIEQEQKPVRSASKSVSATKAKATGSKTQKTASKTAKKSVAKSASKKK